MPEGRDVFWWSSMKSPKVGTSIDGRTAFERIFPKILQKRSEAFKFDRLLVVPEGRVYLMWCSSV